MPVASRLQPRKPSPFKQKQKWRLLVKLMFVLLILVLVIRVTDVLSVTVERSTIASDDTPSTPTMHHSSSSSPRSTSRKGGLVHLTKYSGGLQKVFHRYRRKHLPCFDHVGSYKYLMQGNFRFDRGMFYAKLMKCSSSTLAGIAVQIARNTAKRLRAHNATNITTPHCLVKADHGSLTFTVKNRDKHKSILWTFIREPSARFVSEFYHFQVSRGGVRPTNDNIKTYALKSNSMTELMTGSLFTSFNSCDTPEEKLITRMDDMNSYARTMLNITQYMTVSEMKFFSTCAPVEHQVAYVMNEYDFIGLVERYHESLILLKMIFSLNLRDILYTSAKRSGGYDDGEAGKQCIFIQKSNLSAEVKNWFQNAAAWTAYAAADILLYRVVNKSIDLTIDYFGRSEVQRQVSVLEQALKYADEACGSTAIYPCSTKGELVQNTTCIAHDWACSYACLEALNLDMFA